MRSMKVAVAVLGLAAIVGAGCVDSGRNGDSDRKAYLGFETHPVDQVFRDHNGFRTYHTGEDKVVVEKKYYDKELFTCSNGQYVSPIVNFPPVGLESKFSHLDDMTQCIRIIKDLASDQRGYANVLAYRQITAKGFDFDSAYVEIHLPENQPLSAGTEVYGGKFKTKSPIGEIK